MKSFYGRNVPGQMQGVITRPNVGINEYAPSVSINDNYMSDLLDATIVRDESILLDSVDAVNQFTEPLEHNGQLRDSNGDYVTNADGLEMETITLQGSGYYSGTDYISDNGYVALVVNKANSTWFLRHISYQSVASYSLVDYGLPKSNLIEEHNFSTNNLNDWTATACTPSFPSTNNSLVFIATAQNGGMTAEIPVIGSRKYILIIKCTNPSANELQIIYSLPGTMGNTSGGTIIGDRILSYVKTATTDGTLSFTVRNQLASGWNPIRIYYACLVDVTDETMSDANIQTKYTALGDIPYMMPIFNTNEDGSETEPIFADSRNYAYQQYNYSSCQFNTQADRYAMFSCEYAKVLIYYNYITKVYGKVNLPFYPKKMVTNHNRIFIIDTFNTIWWCRAGDFFSWYSNEYDDDAIVASANMANTSYTIAAQPDVPRPITGTVTQVQSTDTLGIATVVGTSPQDVAQTEVLTLALGRVQGLKSFKTVSTITVSGWTTAGTADTVTFGVAPVSSGFVQADAGYWTLEREDTLTDLCVMSNNIFIFAPDNIYMFQGYSYDTFTMSIGVVNIGIKKSLYPRKWLTTINNISYFIDNGDVYEFNGSSYPKLISHSETQNGSIVNGIMGGIEKLPNYDGDPNPGVNNFCLASDNKNLYAYDGSFTIHKQNYYYVFDTSSKSWVKKTGFSIYNSDYDTLPFRIKYLTLNNTDGMISIINEITDAGRFDMHYDMGHKGLYSPFVVTKAFNTNPSEVGTLTNIILQLKGLTTETSTIVVSYSLTASADDFTVLKTLEDYSFNGDIENIDIPVPVAYIANAHHYRIKIQCSGYTEIFNIERRFRVRGRSR